METNLFSMLSFVEKRDNSDIAFTRFTTHPVQAISRGAYRVEDGLNPHSMQADLSGIASHEGIEPRAI